MIGIQILMKIVSADPYPYTVAGASVALSIYWPGPDEAKVSRSNSSQSSSNRPSSIRESPTMELQRDPAPGTDTYPVVPVTDP